MRYLIVLMVFLFVSCATSYKQENSSDFDDRVVIKNEDLDYEIIIIEPGFNAWLATQQPMSYYQQNTLEIRNKIDVTIWNQRVLEPNRYNTNLYTIQINYDFNTDYGLEVNYKLFMYFKYFKKKYNQKFT